MLKMSGETIPEPFFTNYKNCLKQATFLMTRKKETLSLCFKKAINKASQTTIKSLFFQSAASV